MYLNKAIIIGNLTRDPELKSLPSGVQVATFAVATNRVYKDKNGVKQEDTQFHNIVVFGTQAENTSKYLTKGSNVLVEGRLQTRSWESDGVKKYRTEVVADRVQFGPKSSGGGSRSSSDEGSNQNNQQKQSQNEEATQSNDDNQNINYPDEEINPDDIPF